MRRNLLDVLQLLVSVLGWIKGSLIAITLVFPTVTPASALTTPGLGSVALRFTLKETFENFLADILILLPKPFKIDDHVECTGVEGQIEQITIRDTHIRQTDGRLVAVPNSHLFHNPVTVRTNREVRRARVVCGVVCGDAYGEDVDTSRAIVEQAVRAVHLLRDDMRDVQAVAFAFDASSLDFEITWWTGSRPVDIRASRDRVIGAVNSALDDAGIEIPFSYHTLTVNEPIELKGLSPQEYAA